MEAPAEPAEAAPAQEPRSELSMLFAMYDDNPAGVVAGLLDTAVGGRYVEDASPRLPGQGGLVGPAPPHSVRPPPPRRAAPNAQRLCYVRDAGPIHRLLDLELLRRLPGAGGRAPPAPPPPQPRPPCPAG